MGIKSKLSQIQINECNNILCSLNASRQFTYGATGEHLRNKQ